MATITVKALKLGYYGLQRRKEGDRFEVEESAFSEKWMKKVKAKPRDEDDEDVPERPAPKGNARVVRASDQAKI